MADATCEKCDQFYQDPRMLKCLHTFCLKCLDKELETQGLKDALQCPTCKEKVALENGVSDLPQDLHMANEAEIARISEKVEDANEQCDHCGRSDCGQAVAFCVDCDEFLCKSCEEHHSKWRKTVEHTVVTAGQRLSKTNAFSKFHQQQMPCPRHKGHILEVYCKQCEKLICKNCMDFKHYDHRKQCDLVEEVARQEMESLRACLQDSCGAVATLDTAIAQCKHTMKQVELRKKEVDTAITRSLDQVRKALLAQNEEIRLKKITSLETQSSQLLRVRDGLSHASNVITAAQSHSPAQQLSTKKVLAERARELQKEFRDSKLLPSENDTFHTAIADPDTVGKMTSLGCVTGGSHPASCTSDAGYLPRAVVGKPRTIRVVAKDEEGKPCDRGGERVGAKLVLKGSQAPPLHATPTDLGNGSYSISFTPQSAGDHELHVTIASGHVKGSPFKYHITHPRKVPYTALQSARQYISPYSYSYDVAVTEEGYIAVAEYSYHTVSLYRNDQRVHTFGTCGSSGRADGQFSSPSAVAVGGDLMYVCEAGNKRVQKFSISRRSFISKFGSSGQGNGQFSSPHGICLDPEGNVFIADNDNNHIQVFRRDDSFVYSFPCQQNPWGLAFDLHGRLHVAARGSHCIHVFTPEGVLLTSYGTGTVHQPAGIAIDAGGYIAISEYGGKNRLWIYSPDHTLIHTLTGQFSGGRGIACDKDGNFWVTDYSNNRIAQY